MRLPFKLSAHLILLSYIRKVPVSTWTVGAGRGLSLENSKSNAAGSWQDRILPAFNLPLFLYTLGDDGAQDWLLPATVVCESVR